MTNSTKACTLTKAADWATIDRTSIGPVDWAAVDTAHGGLLNHPSDEELARLLPNVEPLYRRAIAVEERVRVRGRQARERGTEIGRIAKVVKGPARGAAPAKGNRERELRRILEAIDLLSSLSPAHREHIAVRLVSEGERTDEDATAIVARVSMDLLAALGALDFAGEATPLPPWVNPARHEGYEWISMPDGGRLVNAYRPLGPNETCACGCSASATKSA